MTRAGGTTGPEIDGSGLRIGIVAARFNDHIVGRLHAGARRGLARIGVADADVTEAWVPGAFELPLAAKVLAASGSVDAVVCLGVVIKGDTPHFDFVCAEAARGIQQAQLDTGVPVMFGVLTVNTEQQALDRAGDGTDNKGDEAAIGAAEMALLVRCLRG
ncbi:MAG: 6,7-dimethyl-8-ribityllumazine synthase [Ilumatobacteraceae bacterium]